MNPFFPFEVSGNNFYLSASQSILPYAKGYEVLQILFLKFEWVETFEDAELRQVDFAPGMAMNVLGPGGVLC